MAKSWLLILIILPVYTISYSIEFFLLLLLTILLWYFVSHQTYQLFLFRWITLLSFIHFLCLLHWTLLFRWIFTINRITLTCFRIIISTIGINDVLPIRIIIIEIRRLPSHSIIGNWAQRLILSFLCRIVSLLKVG